MNMQNQDQFNVILDALKRLPPIFLGDSYKYSHFNQYPDGTTRVNSYIESRGGAFDKAVFFGLTAVTKRYLSQKITVADVELANALIGQHGVPFNYDGWMRIATDFDGYLPIEIEAMPEGMVAPTKHVQAQIWNTADDMKWVTSFAETLLLGGIWYASTVASLSRKAKELIYAALKETCENPDAAIMFMLQDFGLRGVGTPETGMMGGMGHLVNFAGTDTFIATMGVMGYYNTSAMPGFSVAAMEHSTVTMWGREGEADAYENMLRTNPTGIASIVIDSYDDMNAARNIFGKKLKTLVMERDGVVVFRPDSGDPTTRALDIAEAAMETFGYTVNALGYKVLTPKIRVLQGDGMNLKSMGQLLANAIARGLSVENFVFGMGGALLQKVDRDHMKYAMKASEGEILGIKRDVYKDPKTDPGKRSKRGKLALVRRNGELQTIRADELAKGAHGQEKNLLETVYRNGEILVDVTFEEVRARADLTEAEKNTPFKEVFAKIAA